MTHPAQGRRAILPHVVATGFTTAFLGDERTLREFVAGDHVVRSMREQGLSAVLYLVNDSLDALNERQLRVGVNKDERLIRQFTPFCGRPISEIPDPYGCHGSYSDHFAESLLDRLYLLDIHPMRVDVHRAYQAGLYEPFVSATFQHYRAIQERLAANCHQYTLRNLYRVQCPQCTCIDATEIDDVSGTSVSYSCQRCGHSVRQEVGTLRGKLSWKLDCAARWNLYRIDTEVFSKAHLAETGTLNVSQFVSRNFYGGHVPQFVPYGDVRLDRELSGRLMEMLPPPLLKQLFTGKLSRDLDLTRDFVANFAHRCEVRPGLTYDAYVRSELPRKALQARSSEIAGTASRLRTGGTLDDALLVPYGNRYSEFFYRRRHEIRMPNPEVLESADAPTIEAAREALRFTLAMRDRGSESDEDVKRAVQQWLERHPVGARVYPFLRHLLGQSDGPNITTLLAILPRDYLGTVQMILGSGTAASPPAETGEPDDRARKAA